MRSIIFFVFEVITLFPLPQFVFFTSFLVSSIRHAFFCLICFSYSVPHVSIHHPLPLSSISWIIISFWETPHLPLP